MKLTPTGICKMMNDTYEVLKTMTVEQLERAKDKAYITFSLESERDLFMYQCSETIRRKNEGVWK